METKSFLDTGTDTLVQDPGLRTKPRNMDVLIGNWNNETYFKDNPSNTGTGKMSYEWMEGDVFIIERFENSFKDGMKHSGICIIEQNGSNDTCLGHFFDNQGYTREYEICVLDHEFIIKGDRERYKGLISDDQNTITGSWEQSKDGVNWEYLCDMRMTRE